MTTVALKKWDVVEHIQTEEDMQLYLDACMEEGDPEFATILKSYPRIGFTTARSTKSSIAAIWDFPL